MGKACDQGRIILPETGQEGEANFIPSGIGDIIGFIMTGTHWIIRKETADILSCNAEEGTDKFIPLRLYAGQSLHAASPEKMEKDGFRLVIFMMGQGDFSVPAGLCRLLQRFIPKNAGHGFH